MATYGFQPKTWSWDVDKSLQKQVSREHAGEGYCMVGPGGDFTKQNLKEIPSMHFLCAGPPCPPFSRNGKSQGWSDDRTKVFLQVLACIKEQALREDGLLEAFVLENVPGMDDRKKGAAKSACDEVVQWLQEELAKAASPWSVWAWKNIEAHRLGLPQSRQRTFICGRRGDAFDEAVPQVSPHHVQIPMTYLRDILDPSLPDQIHALSDIQRDNVTAHMAHIEEELRHPDCKVVEIPKTKKATWLYTI